MKVTKEDLIGKIKNVPIEIIQHIIDNEYADLYTLQTAGIGAMILWEETEEGRAFWDNVYQEKYDVFFKKYPKPIEELVPTLEGVLMEVSENERDWFEREVIGKLGDKFLSILWQAECGWEIGVEGWKYAQPKQIKLTKQEIADKFEVDINNLVIED